MSIQTTCQWLWYICFAESLQLCIIEFSAFFVGTELWSSTVLQGFYKPSNHNVGKSCQYNIFGTLKSVWNLRHWSVVKKVKESRLKWTSNVKESSSWSPFSCPQAALLWPASASPPTNYSICWQPINSWHLFHQTIQLWTGGCELCKVFPPYLLSLEGLLEGGEGMQSIAKAVNFQTVCRYSLGFRNWWSLPPTAQLFPPWTT